MSRAFYNRMQNLATDLLTRYGYSIQLIDANRNVLDEYQGLKGSLENENAPASVLEKSTAVVFITSGSVKPTMGNYLQMEGVAYRITHIADVKPTDVNILYKLFIHEGAE